MLQNLLKLIMQRFLKKWNIFPQNDHSSRFCKTFIYSSFIYKKTNVTKSKELKPYWNGVIYVTKKWKVYFCFNVIYQIITVNITKSNYVFCQSNYSYNTENNICNTVIHIDICYLPYLFFMLTWRRHILMLITT